MGDTSAFEENPPAIEVTPEFATTIEPAVDMYSDHADIMLVADGEHIVLVEIADTIDLWSVFIKTSPSWFGVVVAASALIVVWRLRRIRRRPEVKREPHCRRCGYQLTALTSDACPECGWSLVKHRPRIGRSARRRLAMPLLVFTFICAGYGYWMTLADRQAVLWSQTWPARGLTQMLDRAGYPIPARSGYTCEVTDTVLVEYADPRHRRLLVRLEIDYPEWAVGQRRLLGLRHGYPPPSIFGGTLPNADLYDRAYVWDATTGDLIHHTHSPSPPDPPFDLNAALSSTSSGGKSREVFFSDDNRKLIEITRQENGWVWDLATGEVSRPSWVKSQKLLPQSHHWRDDPVTDRDQATPLPRDYYAYGDGPLDSWGEVAVRTDDNGLVFLLAMGNIAHHSPCYVLIGRPATGPRHVHWIARIDVGVEFSILGADADIIIDDQQRLVVAMHDDWENLQIRRYPLDQIKLALTELESE